MYTGFTKLLAILYSDLLYECDIHVYFYISRLCNMLISLWWLVVNMGVCILGERKMSFYQCLQVNDSTLASFGSGGKV